MQIDNLETYVTLSGLCREARRAPATIKRYLESEVISPDGLLVECVGRPGSLLFKSSKLPEITAAIAAASRGVR